jgi:uncharacterized protein
MQIVRAKDAYVFRLDPGEEVMSTLTEGVVRSRIDGGSIVGIGAVVNTTLGYFDLHSKSYSQKEFPDDMELVNFTGNITWVDGKPFIHAHATLSGADYIAYAGHVFSSVIAVTGEFFVHPSEVTIHRELDARTGLKLMAC